MDTSEGDKMDGNPPLVVPLIGQGAASLARASNGTTSRKKKKIESTSSEKYIANFYYTTP